MKKSLLYFALFFYFLALGIAWTYPLIRYFDRGMPYAHAPSKECELVQLAQGDYIQLFYLMWLFKDAIQGGTPFFRDPYQLNLPQYGMQDCFNNQYLPLSAVYALFASILGDIQGYNFLVLMTFPLAGLGFFLLAFAWTKSRWGSLIGATIYVLYPFRVAHLLGGHPGGFMYFLIPWLIYFYAIGLERKSWVWGLAAGLSFFGLGMDELHIAYYLPLFLGIFLVLPLFQYTFKLSSSISWPSLSNVSKGIFRKEFVPYVAIVSFLGSLLGLFLSLWFLRRVQEIWIWLLIPSGGLFLNFFWIGYGWFYTRLTGISWKNALKEDVISYAPFVFLPAYIAQFYFDIPALGARLFSGCLVAMGLIKIFQLLKHRKEILKRSGFSVKGVRGRFKVFVSFVIPMILLFAWLFFEKRTKLDSSVVSGGRSLSVVKGYSAHLSDIWNRSQNNMESLLYPGVVPILLFVLGFFIYTRYFRKKISSRDKIIFAVIACLFILTYLLSLGSTLPLYNLFYTNVPHFDYIRVPSRILYLSFFLLSLLASYGFKMLQSKKTGHTAGVACLVLIGIGIDYFPVYRPGISLMPRVHPIYEYVQKNLKLDERILEVPIWPGESSWSSIYQYNATLYRTPMLNGYRPVISSDYVSHVFKPLSPLNAGYFGLEEWELLKKWNVKFILVHEEAFPKKVSSFPPHFTTLSFRQSPFLKNVMNDQSTYLFEVLSQTSQIDLGRAPVSPMMTVIEGESLKKRMGSVVELEAASMGQALYVCDEPALGWWAFGKSCGLTKGSFTASFRMKGDFLRERKGEAVELEIWDKDKNLLLADRVLKIEDFNETKDFQEFQVSFKLDRYREVEPRIRYGGRGPVWLDRILLGFDQKFEGKDVLEAEELFHQGEILEDKSASGGEVIRMGKLGEKRNILFGPYRFYDDGRYTARFYLKASEGVEQPSDQVAGTLLVTTLSGNKVLFKKEISLKELNQKLGYQSFDLNFELKEIHDLEFTVLSEGQEDLYVDCVEISSKTE
ncbi:MAG: hypothetical protein HYS08_09735 [Chlamydiae bacterium]|nr:hypothetical protein [Chlamydiota bacterium]MBI3267342.1 hypothetical protein [Chlamydiota bacterium]